jgi:murein L,D-transpeptidase YafK
MTRTILALAAAAVLASGPSFSAVAEPATAALPAGTTADRIAIDKSARSLTLFRRGQPLKTYEVALGSNPVGHKQQQGDGRTPEGRYKIDYRNPNSSFHRSLHISYPGPADVRSARRRGVSPGGDIMIHGLPNGMGAVGRLHLVSDWTKGCIAVTNDEIEEIWRVVPDGTVVEITP